MSKKPLRVLMDLTEINRTIAADLFRLRLLSVDKEVIIGNVFDALTDPEHTEEAIQSIYKRTYEQMEPVLDDAEINNPQIYGIIYADLEVLFRIIRLIAWRLGTFMETWRLYTADENLCNFRIVEWINNAVILEEGTLFETDPRAEFDCGIYPFHDILSESLDATTIEDVLSEGTSLFGYKLHIATPASDADGLISYRPLPQLIASKAATDTMFINAFENATSIKRKKRVR